MVFRLLIVSALLGGCVLSEISERQGTKAYLQKDYATAYEKYSEAAADGNAEAQYHLAGMYAEGEGLDKDLSKAAQLLRQASDQGHVDAQVMCAFPHPLDH